MESCVNLAMLAALFPPLAVAEKIGVSLGIGLLVGLEREWAHKDIGVRTFAISALVGMLSALASLTFALVAMVGILIVIAYVNWRSMVVEHAPEATTSVALLATFILGVLTGEGHLFTPIACAVVLTGMLAWKTELQRFAGGLTLQEIRGAVLLGLLAFVIYPILPNRFVDPWHLVNPRDAWVIVVVIAGIGFVNYVLLKTYGTRGLYLSGFLGGLVNSSAAAAELAGPLSGEGVSPEVATAALLLTIVAMFARNIVILVIFAPGAVLTAGVPLVVMAAIALAIVLRERKRGGTTTAEIHLESPVSLKHVFSFAVLFVVIEIVAALGQRQFGHFGFLGISALGGLVSSASTSAAAAKLTAHHQISANLGGAGVVLASLASAVINVPIIHRRARKSVLSSRLVKLTAMLVVVGIAVLVLSYFCIQRP
jgi:uncharacterized membrane protein (DUF4010 family)